MCEPTNQHTQTLLSALVETLLKTLYSKGLSIGCTKPVVLKLWGVSHRWYPGYFCDMLWFYVQTASASKWNIIIIFILTIVSSSFLRLLVCAALF